MRRNRARGASTFVLLVLLVITTTTAGSAQDYSVLYNFGTNPGDPQYPADPGIIAQGRDGSLYSTTVYGGANTCGNVGCGAVFKITPSGALSVVYSFTGGSDGAWPYSGLTLGTDGNFYGAASSGPGYGTIFRITPSGTLTVLHTFTGKDGAIPAAPPVQGLNGNFYGTTTSGTNGTGTVYRVTPAGTFTTLRQLYKVHGIVPAAPLVQATDGNFYGTTGLGGANGAGVAFRITPTGKFTDLYDFQPSYGANPWGGLIQAGDGNFYGMATGGGSSGAGSVFRITSTGQFSQLYSLNGTGDGQYPYAGLVQATDGNFYGTASYAGACPTCGTIFQAGLTGSFATLYDFETPTGNRSLVTLTQHTNGILYGDTYSGGTNLAGVFYSWDAGLGPFVTFLPAQSLGKVGATIGILGQGFNGTTGVSFGGVPATFTVSADTFLAAAVPDGARTGPITVTTNGGTLSSNKNFRVAPVIKSFASLSGPVGTAVVIKGVSLSQTIQVTFGGVVATDVTVNSDTKVTVIVPTGALKGKIAITTPGGTAQSPKMFTVM
jgi:uncharacterized repeat protein (TIGR03803 family)